MILPLALGTVLRSRYKIVELVGQGGMGAVYRAEDMRLEGRQCAVKEVQLETEADFAAQSREQFHREASVLARLDHPNLPKVSDYFSEGGRDYLVMDFVAGRNLKEIMDEARRQGRFLEEKQVRAWVDQLCDALEYLHSLDPPILHRDVKPANIRLTPSTVSGATSGRRPGGTLKLVDFGLVKLLAPDDSRTITILQGRGTIQYTPLEQYGGDTGHTDVRSDIYSLGATLYHLLTNQPPADVKQRFLQPDSLPSPRSLNPRLSPRVERAILRALEMHPDKRPSSVAEFKAELHSFPIPEPLIDLLPTEGEWVIAVQENRSLLAITLVLIALAFLITFNNGL